MNGKSLWIGAVVAGLTLGGCGGVVNSVANAVNQAVQNLTNAAQNTAAYQEAANLSSDAENGQSVASADEANGDVLNELNAGDINVSQGAVGLAPGLDVAAAGFGGGTNTLTREFYATSGRLRHIHIATTYKSGIRASGATDIYLSYSSTPTGNGDLDYTASVSAYVYATITSTTDLVARGTDIGQATLKGFREWNSSPAIHYLSFDLVETLPDNAHAPFSTMTWKGEMDEAAGSGSFARVVTEQDGSTDSRAWSLAVSSGTLDINYTRTAPDGVTASGSGSYNLNGTRNCRLDDTGTFTLTRFYPSQDTTDVVPVKEVVDYSQDGTKTTVDSTLTLSDNSTKTRSQTRWITKPTVCGSGGDGTRTVQFSVSGYNGHAATGELNVTPNGQTLTSTRTVTDGTTVSTNVVRANGLTDINITHTATTGATLSTLSLAVGPGGHAVGTLVRNNADGTSVTIDISRDVTGRYTFNRPGAPRREFRHINRGEL